MIKIDGKSFDVPVVSLTRKADFLDKYATRTENGDLQRELIGVYFNYQIQFGATLNRDEYEALWNKLTEAAEFHEVVVPDEAGDYKFTAYFSNVGDTLRRQIGNKNYFKDLTVNFTAKAPARAKEAAV